MTAAGHRLFACAKRWAERLPREKSVKSKKKCKNQMLLALFSALPPKRDGTHPLDPGKFKLEE